ncbi:MAG TPA: gamma-glutamyl-gamma-aminobutyrate hydrolase family protein [Pyrinomonadaceae bacterium]|nr:gamma-glutamyl-gamma-aminobutyrate hydrolase family protein [Pyrinomonadaceae bacterium]
MKKRARIGITMRLELETNRFCLGRDYSEALENFGAIPLHIPLIPKKEFIAEALKTLDGVLLPGSDSDIDPLIYGEEPLPKLGRVVSEKDETDLLVLREAEKIKMPVLAICFGMEALNVSRGGTLVQDIESQIENCLKHEQGKPIRRNSHSLEIKEGNILSRLITTDEVKVNSSHHQAIKSVGKNLMATAWAKDGVIESIEDTREDRFVFGVQWHPELSWNFDNLSKNIFQTFVSKCSRFNVERK